MGVGNDTIDADHRHLFLLVNSIERALMPGEGAEALPDLVQQLEDSTRAHFAREEAVQQKIHYPQRAGHQLAHQEILAQIGQIAQDVRQYHRHATAGTLADGERELVAQEVMNLLRTWVLDHVLNEDARMRPYLRKLPADFA
jgi:hemerythrin-like metal-binding protein